MDNLKFNLHLVDGSLMTIPYDDEAQTGHDLIQFICGDDLRPPPSYLVIEAEASDGTRVRISISYDVGRRARVEVSRPGDE